uniref:Reverse transcriptase domain-containing protein n=1 Tax=Trichogramma kaykai TaxID=54128 RepID=A0ABD2WIV4_9HYME
MVPHHLLLMKLRRFNFCDSTIKWFASYLRHRSQAVTDSNGLESAWLPTTYDVPQGSVLGPLLFSLIINDLPNVLVDSKCMLFADDLQIYSSFFLTDFARALSAFNRNVNAVSAWATANGLLLNKAKTQVMLMGSDAFLGRFDLSTTRRVLLDGLPLPYATVNILFIFQVFKNNKSSFCQIEDAMLMFDKQTNRHRDLHRAKDNYHELM